MEKNIEEEIARQSELSGVADDDIKKRLEELIADGKSPQGAMAIWKSETPQLKLGPVKDVVFRVAAISDEKNVGYRDGTEHPTVYVDVLHLDKDEVDHRVLSLADENRNIAASLVPGTAYECSARVLSGSNRLSLQGTTILDSKQTLPTMRDMAEAVAKENIEEIDKYIGESNFFKVCIGRHIDAPFGKGMEVSSMRSVPVTCWLDDGVQPPTEGEEVIIFGYVTQKGAIRVKSIIN